MRLAEEFYALGQFLWPNIKWILIFLQTVFVIVDANFLNNHRKHAIVEPLSFIFSHGKKLLSLHVSKSNFS